MAITDKLAAIGDAIREKTGGTAELTLDQMVTEISGITGGVSNEVDILEHTLTTYTNTRVTTVGDGTFRKSLNLEKISLPNAKTLGASVFYQCSKLSEIDLPLVGSMGMQCFAECSQLTNVYLPELSTMGNLAFQKCTSLETLILPRARKAEYKMCKDSTALTKVELGDVSTVSTEVFSGCTALSTVIIRWEGGVATLGGTNSFTGTPIASGTGYIYVPDELVESYKTATNWSTYANQIKPLSEYVEVTE